MENDPIADLEKIRRKQSCLIKGHETMALNLSALQSIWF